MISLVLQIRSDLFATADSTLVTADSDEITADNETPVPKSGKTITFYGRDYQVITVTESPLKDHFQFTLADGGTGRSAR